MMEFKMFVLCVVLLAVATSASSICKCGPEKKDSASTYDLKFSKDGEEYDEKLKVDTEKETETFHVPKTSPDDEEADIIYDFKVKKTMFRVPIAKSCFLYDSTENLPKPEELVQLLETENNKAVLPRDSNAVRLNVQNTVEDRSDLSDEMAALCAKLPIYNVAKGTSDDDEMPIYKVTKETPADEDMPFERKRRGLCREVCRRVCSFWGCTEVCSWVC